MLPDSLGSTLALTDATATVQTEYTYEPFGETTASGAVSTNPFQFTGRENDGTTDLYYYRARYYHPTLQRFISEDPIGFAGGDVNLYRYVENDPVNFIDPEGLQAIAPALPIPIAPTIPAIPPYILPFILPLIPSPAGDALDMLPPPYYSKESRKSGKDRASVNPVG